MAAVNSYTLLDLVDEIIAIDPDAVLIYAGHNEYLGYLGSGTALTGRRSREATRLHLALKSWGLYELLDDGGPEAGVGCTNNETLRAARGAAPPRSPRSGGAAYAPRSCPCAAASARASACSPDVLLAVA